MLQYGEWFSFTTRHYVQEPCHEIHTLAILHFGVLNSIRMQQIYKIIRTYFTTHRFKRPVYINLDSVDQSFVKVLLC